MGVSHIAIDAIGVSKSYATRQALCDVDLIVRRGEVHGLLGPNGAGKTTLLRVLLGLVQRDAGRVQILGRDVDSAAGALADGLSGLIDAPAFYPYMSARKNLALLARLDGMNREERRGAVDAALARAGLAAHADAKVAGYSAGMRQRLGLAGALLRSPQLLLLDEPTSSLDPVAARDVRALARQLANEGTAVLLSSHDMAEVEELCSTFTIIDDGRVVFCGTVGELRRRAPAAPYALHTSDDRAAHAVASRSPGIRVVPSAGVGLDVSADVDALDAFVIALGHAGIAIRGLERRRRSLESLFFELTAPVDRETSDVTRADDDGLAKRRELAS
jgi:ABC-2 type transport system ATP-binding protein